jgi:PAS domain S-box-containing protein
MSQTEAGLADELRRLVVERSHDLVTLIELDGTITYASPSWLRMLGWDPAEVVGTRLLDYCHPDDVERGLEAIAAQARGEQIPPTVTRRKAKDGRWLSVESDSTPVYDAEGNVTAIIGSAHNVTESVELRGRIDELHALYRVADAVARTRSLDELFGEALDALIDATAADRASLLLFDAAGVMRFHAWRGLSEAYRVAAEGHSPWAQDAVDPQPVLITNIADGGLSPQLAAAVQREGIAALAFVPLVHAGQLLGKFMLYAAGRHDWSDGEIRLCLTIANHLASATVRTRTGAALRAQRERLETVMRTVDEGIIVQALDGTRIYANDAAAREAGYETSEELLAGEQSAVFTRFDLLDEHGDPLPIEELPGRKALNGETAERITRYRMRDTGEEYWTTIRANPIRDETGAVVASVSVIHDITKQRRTDERLRFLARASELLNQTLVIDETLAALADLAVPHFAGHVTVDVFDGDVLRCVGARHRESDLTELMLELRHTYPPTVHDHPVQRALRTGEPQFVPDVQAEAHAMAHDEDHVEAIHKLGNESGIVVPLIARGRTFGAITFGTVPPQPPFDEADVELATELGRRAAAALDNALLYEEAQERAHAADALQFVDDGVFLIDRDGIVQLWNPAAARAFRVRADRAIGRHVSESIPDWETLTSQTSAARGMQAIPVTVKGDERWLSASAASFSGGTVFAFRDITDQRAIEQLRSDFVSTVSHELRTPLAAIYGAALTLQRDDVRLEDSQRTGLLDVIASEADRLARIVNDILWASRLDSGQMGIAIEKCDAEAIVTQVTHSLRSHAPSAIVLDVDAEPDLPPIAADPDRLRQVLTNLVDNAVKYSPDGGHVYVLVTRSGNRIRFRVQDEGLGVPPAEQARIFEKFYRLDPQLTRGVGGTGLGLYICRELVQRMHGRIGVNSDGRSGSTFWVELPVA